MSSLLDEISAQEELSRHLFLEVVELRNMEERAKWSKTWRGKYFNFLGYFFSLYCMWKIFIVTALKQNSHVHIYFVANSISDFSAL